jgi:hypothetical protein
VKIKGKTTIFVFGSNLAGRHGAGAALHAKKHHGAIVGCGKGFRGTSYAIPTKDFDVYTPLPLNRVQANVADFIAFAEMCKTEAPDYVFQVTRIGCGLAAKARGVTEEQADREIAPMFDGAPATCYLPREWIVHLPNRPLTAFVPWR